MPRQPLNLPQDAHNLPCCPRPSCGTGDAAIARYLAAWYRSYALNSPGALFFCFRWLRLHETIILLFTVIGKDLFHRHSL